MTVRIILLSAFLTVAASCSGPDDKSEGQNQKSGCVADTECKGERVCVDGECVASDDAEECEDGASRTTRDMCGLNARGTFNEVCQGSEWQLVGECDDPDECVDGDESSGTTACGLNDRGTFPQLCVEGQWEDTDECVDPDVCVDGEVRPGTTACGADDRGTLQQVCAAGQWEDSEECIEPQPSSFASCEAVRAAMPNAPDGQYTIDPDGAGPLPETELFCDMQNGTWTLIGNFYDSAGDDMPNTPDFVESGWQATASGAWTDVVESVDRVAGDAASAAVSLAFVEAISADGNQQNLKMCFVHQNGQDTVCRQTSDGSLTLASESTGNPTLTAFSDSPLVYTYGRLAGLAGSTDSYDYATYQSSNYCIVRAVGQPHDFGTFEPPDGLCEFATSGWQGVWHGLGCGMAYRPWATNNNELGGGQATTSCSAAGPDPSVESFGFRLYVGP